MAKKYLKCTFLVFLLAHVLSDVEENDLWPLGGDHDTFSPNIQHYMETMGLNLKFLIPAFTSYNAPHLRHFKTDH